MTNQQLYFAIGLPILVYLLGFTTTFFVMAWQAKALRETMQLSIDGLRGEMRAEFKAMREALLRVEQVADARIK